MGSVRRNWRFIGLADCIEGTRSDIRGHWAPTLLILGVYNKIVKLQGSDGA